jgi:SAM-dependent methyltransferase
MLRSGRLDSDGDRWDDPERVRQWIANDRLGDTFVLARRLAASLVASEGVEPSAVIDIGAGPGDLLAHFLERFPTTRGVWLDSSEAMLAIGTERLAHFADRVDFIVADMTELATLESDIRPEVLLTSRATHTLDVRSLENFYLTACTRWHSLRWIVNLDHVGHDEFWHGRYQQARRELLDSAAPQRSGGKGHPASMPSATDHLSAMTAAGAEHVDVAWCAFYSALMVGRMPGY